jgi:hypothetical protein
VYKVLVGKPEGKRPLGRPRRRWEVGIRMDLREIGLGCVDWIRLAQDRDRWRAVVSAVMNLGVLAPRSWLVRHKEFFSSVAHPAACPTGIGGHFPGGKARPGCDTDHSPPSSAEVKELIDFIAPLPLSPCMACSGIPVLYYYYYYYYYYLLSQVFFLPWYFPS